MDYTKRSGVRLPNGTWVAFSVEAFTTRGELKKIAKEKRRILKAYAKLHRKGKM